MALDTRIPLTVANPQFPAVDIADSMRRALATRNVVQQGQVNDLQIQQEQAQLKAQQEKAERAKVQGEQRSSAWKNAKGDVEAYRKGLQDAGYDDPDYMLNLDQDIVNRKKQFRAETEAERQQKTFIATKRSEALSTLLEEKEPAKLQRSYDAFRTQGVREGWLTEDENKILPPAPDRAFLEGQELEWGGAARAREREANLVKTEAAKRLKDREQLELDTKEAYESFLSEVPEGDEKAYAAWRKKQKPLVQSRLPGSLSAKLPNGETTSQMFGRLAGFKADKPAAPDRSLSEIEMIFAGLRADPKNKSKSDGEIQGMAAAEFRKRENTSKSIKAGGDGDSTKGLSAEQRRLRQNDIRGVEQQLSDLATEYVALNKLIVGAKEAKAGTITYKGKEYGIAEGDAMMAASAENHDRLKGNLDRMKTEMESDGAQAKGGGGVSGASPKQYAHTATGPGGVKVGSNDGVTWFDLKTGKKYEK